jgi:capsule polysaccharide export protein KpsC/LpsZ
MKIQLSIIKDKISVHYVDESNPYMKTNYINYENLSEEDRDKVENAVDFFKDLKEKDVHVQEPTR